MSLKSKVEKFLDEFDTEVFGFAGEMDDTAITLSQAINDGTDDEYNENYFDGGDARVSLVDNYGGEGQGDEFWYVLKFTEGARQVFVRLNGSYSSYAGRDYDDWEFVKPVQVTRTEWAGMK